MCGITGWVDFTASEGTQTEIVARMNATLAPRGPDDAGIWTNPYVTFGHRRLSIIDPLLGKQPMIRTYGGHTYGIVYNGELYNAPEMRQQLIALGHVFYTSCDTEVLLVGAIEWGEAVVTRLNGIFAFALWNPREEAVWLCRDRLGVKPLFYASIAPMGFLFGSEQKALLAHPQMEASVDAEGLAEVLALGPARTPGHALYRGMHEVKAGGIVRFDRNGVRKRTYWRLEAHEHPDDAHTTANTIRTLLYDTVSRQLVADVPVCTLLSGGLDSSALTAIASASYAAPIRTFSVNYAEQDAHFRPSAYTPESDEPWIDKMIAHSHTHHTRITLDTPALLEALHDAVIARDAPGMADVDASLLLFCRAIRQHARVALSGEAADELFGGYPWFHRQDALTAATFPWANALPLRAQLIHPSLHAWIRPAAYAQDRYQEAIQDVPTLPREQDTHAARIRTMHHLNLTRFMPTLLERKDRMSMACGLEIRVPYCDHRLVEYVYNIPWEMKMQGKHPKGILREALHGTLPSDILYRQKSPYPKTHHPAYTEGVRTALCTILAEKTSPLCALLHTEHIRQLTELPASQMHLPWFGQLMSGPQLFAYLLQVHIWLTAYRVRIVS